MFKWFVCCFLGLASCTGMVPGNGKKIGRIVKLSKDGFFCKTWEGELIRGGFSDGDGTLGGAFHFTIESEDLAALAQICLEERFEVIVEYKTEFLSSLFRSENLSPYFVTKITKK